MTTQLQSRERSDATTGPEPMSPDVLFEEARQRRRRRWMAWSALITAAIIAATLILGTGGGGDGGSGHDANGHPSSFGSGLNSSHLTSRLFPGAPSTQHYYTGPGPECALAPRNRYLPRWSGCVSVMVADVSGNGHPDLILTYSRLSHVSSGGSTLGSDSPGRAAKLYSGEEAMLRIVSPDGHVITTPIEYRTTPFKKTPAQLQKAQAAALISVAHVNDLPGKEIFIQTGEISSGTLALPYSLFRGRLVSSGVFLGYGGDSGAQNGFQCLPGNPPRVVAHNYQLIGGAIKVIHKTINAWWQETTATLAWRGPRLVKIAQSTARRLVAPNDHVGIGCIKGIS